MVDTANIRIEQTRPELGRHIFHDARSLDYAATIPVDKSTWVSKQIRIYDPSPNPNQTIGNCTAVSKCVQFNAAGNRKSGVVLNMSNADSLYHVETQIDSFPGVWPPNDTGSNGLAACKAAQQKGLGGAYFWIFGGADECVQNIMSGRVVSVGTYWYNDMFHPQNDLFSPDHLGIVHPTGGVAGGHQWSLRGYDKTRDLVMGRCWWGSFKDFWIRRQDLDALLKDGGDAHFQVRA